MIICGFSPTIMKSSTWVQRYSHVDSSSLGLIQTSLSYLVGWKPSPLNMSAKWECHLSELVLRPYSAFWMVMVEPSLSPNSGPAIAYTFSVGHSTHQLQFSMLPGVVGGLDWAMTIAYGLLLFLAKFIIHLLHLFNLIARISWVIIKGILVALLPPGLWSTIVADSELVGLVIAPSPPNSTGVWVDSCSNTCGGSASITTGVLVAGSSGFLFHPPSQYHL